MAYDQAKLISDVRRRLGYIDTTQLPDNVITDWGDHYDEIYSPKYEEPYPYIYYYSTLSCVEYLRIQVITSGEATRSKFTEKVGNVSITEESSSSESILNVWDDLYKLLADDPSSFGITTTEGGFVHIGGTDTCKVESIRKNSKLASPFDTGKVTSRYNTKKNPAFDKFNPWR